ncbi:MAG: hypothetical protein AAF564_20185 [Bacteroidota bacterium]
MKKKASHCLYLALGIQESEPGFSVVSAVIGELGKTQKIGASFWKINSRFASDEAFKQINASMVDRRIDSSAALMLLDPANGSAKWHLQQPMADLINTYWDYQNNLFISFSLQDAGQNRQAFFERLMHLGIWAPLSKTIWYLSSAFSSNDAFHYLVSALKGGEGLSVLDSKGNIAFWQAGPGAKPQDPPTQTPLQQKTSTAKKKQNEK